MTNKIAQDRKEELLEAILFHVSQQDSWKDDLKNGIQNRLDFLGMDSFDHVYKLFEERFILLTEGFAVGDNAKHFDFLMSKRNARFMIFEDYGLFLRQNHIDGPIVVSILENGDTTEIHEIKMKNNRFKMNRQVADELLKMAFSGLIEDDIGFVID